MYGDECGMNNTAQTSPDLSEFHSARSGNEMTKYHPEALGHFIVWQCKCRSHVPVFEVFTQAHKYCPHYQSLGGMA